MVCASTGTADAFEKSGTDDSDVIGAVYDAGVADGDWCRVVVGGRAQVLLKDTTASTLGYWVKTSDTAGRADATTSVPPGHVAGHWQEIGHALETVSGGTDVLAWVMLHFN